MLSYIDIEAFTTADYRTTPKPQAKPTLTSTDQAKLVKVSRPQTQQQMTKGIESNAPSSKPKLLNTKQMN